MSSAWWTFLAPSFSTLNCTVWPTVSYSGLSVTSYLSSSFRRTSHHCKLIDVFEIVFLTKCQWNVHIHCLPVLGEELERSAAALIYCDGRCSLNSWGSCNTPPTPGRSYLLPVQGCSSPARLRDWLLHVLGSLLSCQLTSETFPDHPVGRANTSAPQASAPPALPVSLPHTL